MPFGRLTASPVFVVFLALLVLTPLAVLGPLVFYLVYLSGVRPPHIRVTAHPERGVTDLPQGTARALQHQDHRGRLRASGPGANRQAVNRLPSLDCVQAAERNLKKGS
jgi:hypothetical protein